MRQAYDVIVTPVVTEKSTQKMVDENLYTFIVNADANKHEIARAVEALWDVTVENVRTMRYSGKLKRAMMGRMSRNAQYGRRPSFKKAMVSLSEGDEIELYEIG